MDQLDLSIAAGECAPAAFEVTAADAIDAVVGDLHDPLTPLELALELLRACAKQIGDAEDPARLVAAMDLANELRSLAGKNVVRAVARIGELQRGQSANDRIFDRGSSAKATKLAKLNDSGELEEFLSAGVQTVKDALAVSRMDTETRKQVLERLRKTNRGDAR